MRELKASCKKHLVLPRSHAHPFNPPDCEDREIITHTNNSVVYKLTRDGDVVCVKTLRANENDVAAKEVRLCAVAPPACHY